MSNVVISGSGLFVPGESVSNDQLVETFNQWVAQENQSRAEAASELPELSPSGSEFIFKASGIESRYLMDAKGVLSVDRMRPQFENRDNQQLSIQAEMGVKAALEALEQAGLKPEDIDAIIVACSNLQRAYPAVAIEIQNELSIDGYAYDMNVACSSATFGIQAARDAIANGSAGRVLVINPEICSAHLNFRDRDSHFIFGDACTAVLLESEAKAIERKVPHWKILDMSLKTSFSNNIRNNAGYLNPCEEPPRSQNDRLFIQQGRKVFKDVVPMVAAMIGAQLEKNAVDRDGLNRMWLHQANINMNNLIAKKVLGREASEQESPVILNEFANTSSAGSVIAFHRHNSDLPAGSVGLLCSFGAGYSVGSVLLSRNM